MHEAWASLYIPESSPEELYIDTGQMTPVSEAKPCKKP